MLRTAAAPLLALALACSKSGGEGTTTSASTEETGAAETTDGPATSDSGTTTPDLPAPAGECIAWAQDCPREDLKCMPWSENPDRLPDEYRCCAAPAVPKLVGERCSAEGYDGSCLDDCEVGSICIVDDPEGLRGSCRRFCDPAGSTCDDDQRCKSFFEMLEDVPNVPVCMDTCDPLVQDCVDDGWSCLPDSPTTAGMSGFICTPPPPGPPYGPLDPCLLANDCERGLLCVTAEHVPGCTSRGCCTSYCSLSEAPDPCPAFHGATVCTDWQSPDPQWADVGVCSLPG